LRQCHGDLDAPPFAIGGLGQGSVGEMIEADPSERLASAEMSAACRSSRKSGFQRNRDRPRSESTTLCNKVSPENSVII
jgi:hypothetical protein